MLHRWLYWAFKALRRIDRAVSGDVHRNLVMLKIGLLSTWFHKMPIQGGICIACLAFWMDSLLES